MVNANGDACRSDAEEASQALYEVIGKLLDNNVNPGCIAACLTMHATKLSFLTCDQPTMIFENILTSILNAMPPSEHQFESCLGDKITHQNISELLN